MFKKIMRASLILVFCMCASVNAWDNEEFEIFDLVEEVNQNFYKVLEIEQDASTSEVKRAYRKLSLALHPDKNKAADAEVKFRQLVAIYEIIKDPAKRKRYDDVLENGLPDWRQAVYYYRRVRKMGLAEMIVILFIIVSIGQYCVAWAVHIEHKFNAEKYLSSKLKKQQKKLKKTKGDGTNEIENILSEIPTPSVKNTLPFQIPRFIWTTIISLPHLYRMIGEHIEEQRKIKEEQLLREKEEEEEENAEVIPRGPRRRKGGPFIPEYTGDGPEGAPSPIVNAHAASLAQARREMRLAQKSTPVQSSGLWTDDDIVELIRLVKKYPSGTLDRWEKIAEAMNRPVADVTHMAKKVKEDGYKVPGPEKENDEVTVDADVALMGKSKKVKTRGGKVALADTDITVAEVERQDQNMSSVKDWTQLQQKKLEAGLLKYPKGSVQDRWEKIASFVPDKTKEECMLRFKYLYEKVQKEKREKDLAAQQDPGETPASDASQVSPGQDESQRVESSEVLSCRSEEEIEDAEGSEVGDSEDSGVSS